MSMDPKLRCVLMLTMSLAILAALISFFTGWAVAQAPFGTEQTITTTAFGAISVYTADVDGDGDMDVLSASANDHTIAWYENDGSQIFATHTITTAADSARSVYAADVDGDGDMDALSASFFDDMIAWYENTDGAGSFGSQHVVNTPDPDSDPYNGVNGNADGAVSVYAADLDEDGDMDIFSASLNDDKIAWYENDGSQNFTPHTITTAANGTESLYVVDLDGDGDLDTLAFNGASIDWYENDGSQNFTPHTLAAGLSSPRSLYATDVDGDGDMDVLSASANDDRIAWYENDGSQNFTPHTITTTANFAESVYAADLDGDGDVDVLSASANDNKVAWYENDGSQNFTPHTLSTTASGAWSVFTADLDGDGDMDVLSASLNDNKIAWYENKTIHRSALFPTQSLITTTANGAASIYAADVDEDGDMDALAASASSIDWYENDGSQNFIAHTISFAVAGAYSVYAIDMDGDGDMDALSASQDDDKIAWYENDGSQIFATHTITTTANQAFSVYAIDVDGDGDMDVLSASGIDNKVAWYENDGSQNFTSHTISTATFGPRSVYATDVDGDGDMDVLSASANDNRIAWYENDGSQNFTLHTISVSAAGAFSVYAIDVDRDGDMDVLSASVFDNKIAWYENDGSQNFTPHTISTTADVARSVYAADLDKDMDIDVLSASFNDDKIAWYENDGSQNFTPHIITTAADGAESAYAADVDGDGDMDVLSASYYDDKIAWYENRGGQFALPTINTAPATIEDGLEDDVLQITAAHRGRTGDTDVELVTFELLFEESPSDPLTTSEANNLLDKLHIYRDTGSSVFESGTDTLVTTVDDLNLSAGVQIVTFADSDPNLQVSFGTPVTYFVVPELTDTASSQTPNQFQVTHLTESSSSGEDRDYDLPLTLEYAVNVTSSIATAIDNSFAVVTTGPTGNGRVISQSAVISASFSKVVNFSTATSQTFIVRGQQTGAYNGIYNPGSIQFEANNNFKSGEELVVNLNSGVKANDGSILPPFAWQFRAAVGGGSGSYTLKESPGSLSSFEVALGDLDNDTDLDAFIVNASALDPGGGQPNKVWFNTNGSFSDSGQNLSSSEASTGVALGDLDDDGDLDAFVTNWDQKNHVLRNGQGADPLGTFSLSADSGHNLGNPDKSRAVALADLNGDGHLDAFVANEGSNNTIWLNDGDGTAHFSAGQVLPGSANSWDVALGDLNSDGFIDAYVVNQGQTDEIWLNDGSGNFTLDQSLSGSTLSRAVALGDVDGDGDLDAMVAHGLGLGEPNKLWLNNNGTFSDSSQSIGGSNSRAVALGDVDADNDLDAIFGNLDANKVWLNDGNGIFSDSGQNLGDSTSYGLALGNVGGSSALAVFVANGDNEANKVWLNGIPVAGGGGNQVYLPLIFKPDPSVAQTELFVKSINTSGITLFEIRDPSSNALLLSCTNIGNNVTQLCGTIPSVGSYNVTAYTNKCGPLGPQTFNDATGGSVTRSAWCN